MGPGTGNAQGARLAATEAHAAAKRADGATADGSETPDARAALAEKAEAAWAWAVS